MSIPKIPPNLLRDAANIGRIFGITIKKQRNFKQIGKIAGKHSYPFRKRRRESGQL